ncbi:hypothetical protein L3Q82_012558 [Scortum barcoo]|uniref:Uncharacterized protein n=1 Tax=Scortum barcoo TaxID=214431 RepID=A0ACB8W4V0_9TELE|nr:hypothetical protein L3Q82_012558 [Scortum barcoo]
MEKGGSVQQANQAFCLCLCRGVRGLFTLALEQQQQLVQRKERERGRQREVGEMERKKRKWAGEENNIGSYLHSAVSSENMGAGCECHSWTLRPVWPLLIILATLPCVLYCSESPAAVVGKMYPRGNHWAVGHLMGKKSIESLPELQETNSDFLPPSKAAGLPELDRYERLLEALMQQKNQKQMIPQNADGLLRLQTGWREEDRDKYLREMSDLLLLALKLRDNDST